MYKRYEAIKDYIRATLKSHLNEHNLTRQKLKLLCDEAFEIGIDETTTNNYDINTKGKYLHQKIPYNLFLYKLMLLKENKITYN